MTDQYYAEEIGPDGQPVPVKYHGDYPGEKTASGKRRKFHRQPVKIRDVEKHLSLFSLRLIYGSDAPARKELVDGEGFITVHGGV